MVALFVRMPVPGQVKTRLAADLGRDSACRLYCAMVADSLRIVQAAALPLYLFHDGTGERELPPAWVAAAVQVHGQQGEGLGERMAAAFEQCFAEGIPQVVLVGSDIPGLDGRRIVQAVAALEAHDAAITPVVDGGYCLIAMKRERYRRRIFEEIPWSTDQVLRVTLQRFEECGLSVSLQSDLHDIDTMEDVRHYCRNPCAQASATNQVLAQLRAKSFGGK